MFNRILVPIDGSVPSRFAMRLAMRLAKIHRSELIFLFVVETVNAATAQSPSSYLLQLESERARGKTLLESAHALAGQSGLRATTLLLEGPCVGTILETANLRRANVIVIGSHGRKGFSRLVLGSVAEGVSRGSRVPVITIHAPSPTAARPNGAATLRARRQIKAASRRLVRVF